MKFGFHQNSWNDNQASFVSRFANSESAGLASILPAVLLFYGVLLPSEVRIVLAEQNLYPTRLIALAIAPWIIYRMFHQPIRWLWLDGIIVFSAGWMVAAFVLHYGAATGLRRGGILAFDLLVPYLVGRHCFRSTTGLRRFLVLVAPGLVLAASTLLIEVLAAKPLIRPAVAAVFGNLEIYEDGQAVGMREAFIDHRLGILRATGPFPHPILAGIMLASFLPIFALSSLRDWPRVVGIVTGLFAVFSASSAAFLALVLGLGLTLLDWLQKRLAFISWKVILLLTSQAMIVLHFLTERGLVVFLSRFTLNPQTSSYRRQVWHYGTQSVEQHPWFGIGFADFERPLWMVSSSVDNHWLLLAIRFGLLPSIMIFTAVIVALYWLCIRSTTCSEINRKLCVGTAIALFSMGLLGFSVAFFGGVVYWFYMLLAIAVSIAASPNTALNKRVRIAVDQEDLGQTPIATLAPS